MDDELSPGLCVDYNDVLTFAILAVCWTNVV